MKEPGFFASYLALLLSVEALPLHPLACLGRSVIEDFTADTSESELVESFTVSSSVLSFPLRFETVSLVRVSFPFTFEEDGHRDTGRCANGDLT